MKVLLGIGGSEDSFRALSRTIDRTREAGDDLTVAILENPESDVTRAVVEERARDALDEAGLDAAVRSIDGDPGSRLVAIAEDEGFDAIALGGGVRSPMGKITVGHIAEFLILNAPTSVILVR